jgi:hypothetical protein
MKESFLLLNASFTHPTQIHSQTREMKENTESQIQETTKLETRRTLLTPNSLYPNPELHQTLKRVLSETHKLQKDLAAEMHVRFRNLILIFSFSLSLCIEFLFLWICSRCLMLIPLFQSKYNIKVSPLQRKSIRMA